MAFLVLWQVGAAEAVPPPEGGVVQSNDVTRYELAGERVESVLLAWDAIARACRDVPPLRLMKVSVLSYQASATIIFAGPLRSEMRDGVEALVAGSNYFQVVVEDGVASVLQNGQCN